MEAIEEPSAHSTVDSVKVNVVDDKSVVVSVEADLCRQSNGVAEAVSAGYSMLSAAPVPESNSHHSVAAIPETEIAFSNNDVVDCSTATDNIACLPSEAAILAAIETTAAVENLLGNNNLSTTDVTEGSQNICHDNEIPIEESTVEVCTLSTSNDNVTFKTEILVEKNENDISHDQLDSVVGDHDNTNNILSELGQGIELSDVLRSSDTDNVENNNSGRQEMFNKEELLDILEGNDVESTGKVTELLQSKDPDTKKILEQQIAMKQLSRLKKSRQTKKKRSLETNRKRSESFEKPPRKKRETKPTSEISNDTEENTNLENENTNITEQNTTSKNADTMPTEENSNTAEKKKNDSIVNVLVKDWDDDEPVETDQPHKSSEDCAGEPVDTQATVTSQEKNVNRTSTDSPTCESENASLNKSTDEGQPQRRLGRVIKKKVIFDPDNPDTFTKGKVVPKTKESHVEKEQTPTKKNKADEKQVPKAKSPIEKPRPKSKSPISKMSWKKPTPRNSNKQNKRLTEVDKLLMDEGAVNMIYQLTPEAPKGGTKNMKTKAEFIKKIQSSTPDGKEMKFRERKKEVKSEEEAKKISGGKQRSSLSSSVQSPSVCEDFETHSADDSIIYRRHSSSSYSSTCMSPRRLSDVDAAAVQSAAKMSRQPPETQNQALEARNGDQDTDVFMAGASNASTNEFINKDDCMSIKEKLNSKLSLALNKRKRDSSKSEKPSKQKKISKAELNKNEAVKVESIGSFKYLSVNVDQRLAEICIRKTGTKVKLEILQELDQALAFVDSRKDTSVTLITSECGTLCSELDLEPLLDDNLERRTNYAFGIAESVRCLLCSVSRHSKLVVSGVWGACAGVALALVALSDVALASERASFGTSAGTPAAGAAPPLPAAAALTARRHQIGQSLLNDLVLFGRRVSAAEAERGGLVCRALWPARVADQVRAIAGELAARPPHSVLLKKQLLSLNMGGDTEATFLSSLETERDLLVQYWTSVEGQEVLRACLDAS